MSGVSRAGEPAFTPPASTGITTGWPDHTFRPTARVERQAMAAFLMRFEEAVYGS